MKGKGIIISDIDDTILSSNVNDIGIIKHKDGKELRLSTEEFAKDQDKGKPGIEYDISEFSDPIKVRNSIINGTPLLKNLRIIDDYLDDGYDFCFLTARSCEDVIKDVMGSFMKWHSEDDIKELGDRYKKGLSYAISDEKYCEVFDGLTHPERKAEVLKIISDLYEHCVFLDDDVNNISYAKKLGIPNLEIIHV